MGCIFSLFPLFENKKEYRDSWRTARLQRSETRARNAGDYVIETHKALSSVERTLFDRCFDSSRESVQAEVRSIVAFLEERFI